MKIVRLFISIIILGFGCRSQDFTQNCALCPSRPPVNPNLKFNIVDKNSGSSLFFGSSAKYRLTQISTQHLKNGNMDSIRLMADTLNKYFTLFVLTIHSTDTILVNITGLKQDVLFFNTKTEKCCGTVSLKSVSYNSVIVFPNSELGQIAILKK